MIGQKTQVRTFPPPPPEFAQQFIEGGWRRIERLYNCRTHLGMKWIEMCGGNDLKARRKAHMRGEA